MSDDEKPIDPRRIPRQKDKVQRGSDLEKKYAEAKTAVYYTKKEDYQKKLDDRAKELQYAGFDHDRKSKAKSPMIPILQEKLVPNDLHTPELEQTKTEKTRLAKNLRFKKRSKLKTRQREK